MKCLFRFFTSSRGGLGAFLIIARLLLLSLVDITRPMRGPPVGLARGIGVIALRLLPETKTNRLQRGCFYMDALPPLSRPEVGSGQLL